MLVLTDIGNSRAKWALVRQDKIDEFLSLPLPESPDSVPNAWEFQLKLWHLPRDTLWIVASTNPPAAGTLQRWLETQGFRVKLLASYQDIPLALNVDYPERVGIDRLLNGLAAVRQGPSGRAKFIVDAGSAVTIDWVDANNTFCGGAILPGFRLMSESLHRYTARLPLVKPTTDLPKLPAKNTEAAIQAGMLAALVGAITWLKYKYLEGSSPRAPIQVAFDMSKSYQLLSGFPSSDMISEPACYVTGGDATLLRPYLDPSFTLWPEMTLEGLFWVSKHYQLGTG